MITRKIGVFEGFPISYLNGNILNKQAKNHKVDLWFFALK